MTTDSKTGSFWSGGWKRGLMVLSLVAVGGLVPGCFVETSSGPPPPPPTCLDSNITFDWVITANGVSRSCAQVGATTVSIMVDSAQMIVDFDCSLFAGTTPAIQGGVTHRITMILSDSAGNILSQLAPTNVPVGCDTVANLGTVEFSLTP